MHHREEISILYCWKQTPGSHESKVMPWSERQVRISFVYEEGSYK